MVFSEIDVLQPDVLLFTAARAHLVDLDAPIRHAPDLCVEVLSPSTAAADRGRKLQMYARYGVPEYWIVDPAGRLEMNQLTPEGYTVTISADASDHVTSPTLAGLTFSVPSILP